MDETTRRGPVCRKCKQLMVFHSVQEVGNNGKQKEMLVFECKRCERLAAVPMLKRVA